MAKNFEHTKPYLIKDYFDREPSNFFFECEPEHRVINAKKEKHEILDYHMTQLGYHYFFDIAELHKWYTSEVLGKQRFSRRPAKNGRFGYLVSIHILRSELPQGAMSERVDEITPLLFPDDDEPNLGDIPF